MKIAYLTAGAASMYCGSCVHDNTLVAALQKQGHDAVLLPLYTPIRTDEENVSEATVLFGGVNVYLQQTVPLFRYTPRFIDRLFDLPRVLRWATGSAIKIDPKQTAELTLSTLKGEHGNQRKEVARLARWLGEHVQPQLVNLTAVLLSGVVHEIKQRLPGVPVLATLQGDDIFLDGLPEPYKSKAIALIRDNCSRIDGFISTSAYNADHMADYLGLPREKIHVVHPGLNLRGHGAAPPEFKGKPFTIGYFARICPEKGLHILLEAFRILREDKSLIPCVVHASGYLGKEQQPYLDGLRRKLEEWHLADQFQYLDSPDHGSKVTFLQHLDVLAVPTVYREPKGLYVLEALANGVPVVQPRHGSFPELVERTRGGVLHNPDDPVDLARVLRELMLDPVRRAELGRTGKELVQREFTADVMARKTVEVYEHYVPRQEEGRP